MFNTTLNGYRPQAAKTDSVVQRRSTYVKIPSRCVVQRISHQHSIHGSIRVQKEPKLSRARRIPEWEEYNEIARFVCRLVAEGKIHASVATADSNVPAGSGGQPPSLTNTGSLLADEASPSHDEL
ncbi:hypothetical protein HD554DRAFT_966294 [Boletus coccyginus]|nr:hypothetical protein HD554DRAFT_966294 [Boletus coccyginus]